MDWQGNVPTGLNSDPHAVRAHTVTFSAVGYTTLKASCVAQVCLICMMFPNFSFDWFRWATCGFERLLRRLDFWKGTRSIPGGSACTYLWKWC